MRKLSVFNFISLNGCYKGPNEDISWHKHGKEENEFAEEDISSDNILLFGRVTYEMMAGYWPTDEAIKNEPELAEGMNKSEKIVFSKTLNEANWNNTRIISSNIIDEIKKIKLTPGKDMTLLGSGKILTQFAEAGLIDNFQIMVDPVVISNGTSIFADIKNNLNLYQLYL